MGIMISENTSLFYRDSNSTGRPAVLLLHGLGSDSSSWQMQEQDLISAGFRLIVPDLPGFGRSIYKGERWTIRKAARLLAEMIIEIQTQPLNVVGLSLGGVVALQFGLDYPGLVSHLVLVNTFARLRPHRPNEWLYLLRRFIKAQINGVRSQAEDVAWRIFPAEDQAELRRILINQILAADPLVYRAAMRSLAIYDARNRLHKMRLPVMVISGANDTTVPLINQHELVEGIPGARQVIIPDAGHAVPIDQPDVFNQVLVKFLLEG